jgi:hypothetical protein
MATRTFTLDEAHSLLPVLESLLKRAMRAKQSGHEYEQELQQLKTRIAAAGGMLVDVRQAAQRKAQLNKSVQSLKDSLAEIDAMGVQVKDLDIGLLDFPCVVEDRVILLCWKLGEAKISYWHGTDEGFAARKPIDSSILKSSKPEDVN